MRAQRVWLPPEHGNSVEHALFDVDGASLLSIFDDTADGSSPGASPMSSGVSEGWDVSDDEGN